MLDLIARIRGELGSTCSSPPTCSATWSGCSTAVMAHGGYVLAQGSIAEAAGTTEPGVRHPARRQRPRGGRRPGRGRAGGPPCAATTCWCRELRPGPRRGRRAGLGPCAAGPAGAEPGGDVPASPGRPGRPGDPGGRDGAHARGGLGCVAMTEVTAPGGTIYDRGYRHYEGPRGRGRHAGDRRRRGAPGPRPQAQLEDSAWSWWGLLVLASGRCWPSSASACCSPRPPTSSSPTPSTCARRRACCCCSRPPPGRSLLSSPTAARTCSL